MRHMCRLLGYIGAACFLAAGASIVAATALRARWRAAPGGVVLLLASVSFLDSHIFWPRGVFTMIGAGLRANTLVRASLV